LHDVIAVSTGRLGRVASSTLVPRQFGRREKMTDADDTDRRHTEKMVRRKQVQDFEVASKTITSKGLLMINTGRGKGKSTASFGLVLRALGHGWRVGVVQFIKGAWQTGERAALERFSDLVEWHTMGEGFTWETQDRQRDIAAAARAWAVARRLMDDPSIRLLVLDELNIALRYDYLALAEVLTALQERRDDLNIVVTGRNAKSELVAIADLVTEMTLIKHHFAAGVKAQPGIEF
jgi:cob(I)alamin adenosyltransferase